MDIGALQVSEATSEMQVKDLKGKPAFENGEPVTITFRSADSAAVVASREKRSKERSESGDTILTVPTVDRLVTDQIEDCVAATVSWKHLESGGKPLECTQANARLLYKNTPVLREQAWAWLNSRANFIDEQKKT